MICSFDSLLALASIGTIELMVCHSSVTNAWEGVLVALERQLRGYLDQFDLLNYVWAVIMISIMDISHSFSSHEGD